ncbi:MAG: aminopeptidase N [Kangiellaceae bacterium]|nr:aminopeptidase N [Kangiellaceae bacterium]
MKVVAVVLMFFVFGLLSGCSDPEQGISRTDKQSGSETSQYVQRVNKAYLSEAHAMQRSSRISQVSYNLKFNLTGLAEFSGETAIEFSLKDASFPITLDLNKAKIKFLKINGTEVQADYNDAFITLPAENLVAGKNRVIVNYSRKHSTNGEGLHRFVDPVDKRVYLYSHFEPAAAHQMFALFDQPDLKATYEMTVTAPADWVVITAEREDKIREQQTTKTWHFPTTPKLSPYNFSLHAGPYKMWKDDSAKYPMRLFARQSISDKIVPADWFRYTKSGLDFFDEYFGIPYPFKKYDQVIVPDFLYGAMENAAAITFAERAFVSSGEMSSAQKQRLAGVIMHEMAHQWFGNLVTMKWWNGLWLNESFASFMGTLATAEVTEFDYAWRSFYARSKQSAYVQDQRVTTHPIEVPVPTSHNAFDNIDAITYSKGASTLKQLRQLLGPDTFKLGVQNYLSNNSYENAKLDDFIGALATTAGRELGDWTQQWLYKAGVNAIKADFQCEQGKIVNFQLLQSADHENGTLREQKVNVGLFSLKKGQLALDQSIPVIYRGAVSKVDAAVGLNCPKLVYPNYQDWGFVKVNLDKRSFETAKDHLSQVSDPLLRSMLWQSLWDSVRDSELPIQLYLDTAMTNIKSESDYTTLGQALGNIEQSVKYINRMGDKGAAYLSIVQPQIESLYWSKVIDVQQGDNFQRRWFNAYIEMASSIEALAKLKLIYDEKLKIEGLEINQQHRWSIIHQLNRFDYPSSKSIIDQELVIDSGDSGQKKAIASRVVRPNMKNKQKWLDKIHGNNAELPFSKLRVAIYNLYTSEQTELEEQTAEQILNSLPLMDKEKGVVFMRTYASVLIPATCSMKSVKRLEKLINQGVKLSNITKRALLVTHQEDQRCVNIANKFASELIK